MHNKTQKEWLDDFRQICKRHNLNVTPQRIAVYEAAAHSKKHPSAEDIFDQVKNKFPDMSIDTVYRTLSIFAKIGLLRIVEGYGEPRRYDPDTRPHHHFRCLECNQIIDFENPEYNKLDIPDSIKSKYQISGLKVVLEGLCEQCRDKI